MVDLALGLALGLVLVPGLAPGPVLERVRAPERVRALAPVPEPGLAQHKLSQQEPWK